MASSLPTFAAGVSIPSYHFRRNLATKTNHKATTMARTTQHDELGSCVFVSPPSLLIQRNGVTTRRGLKTTVDAAPQEVTIRTEGIPEQTTIEIKDETGGTGLKLDDQDIWEGNEDDIPDSLTFTQKADPGDMSKVLGSAGGVEYKINGTDLKLIVAWANLRNLRNKVYTLISNESVKWNSIKTQVYKSTFKSEFNKDGYHIEATIDEIIPAPKLEAKLTIQKPGEDSAD